MNRRQQGYTLVELMISLLLGLMLISGFGSLFSQTQKNATIQRSLSYMMEDGRYVLEIFGKELRRTGFLRNRMIKPDINSDGILDSVFSADANVLASGMNFVPDEYIMGVDNATEFGAGLVLRYQLNDNTELAPGNSSAMNSACENSIRLTDDPEDPDTVVVHENEDPAIDIHVVTLYFFVADSTDPTLTQRDLYCVAKRQNFNDPSRDVTSARLPLISNVQQLLISYGIDTDADGAANYYVNASSVPAWTLVVSAKLSVVLQSEDDNLIRSPTSYIIDGATSTVTDTTDSLVRLYRVFSTTIAFRN